MSGEDRAARWLGLAWWAIFPPFLLLTIRLAAERACADPYDLLPALASNPVWAWPIAAVYVLAHLWVACAYVATVSHSGTLVPGVRIWRGCWGRQVPKLALMALAFALEYAPMQLWRVVASQISCRG